MDVVRAGRTFFLVTDVSAKRHLWLILTDPDGTSPNVVAVMVRTATKFTDETIILDIGDHPFISRPSSVHYSTADLLSVTKILHMSNRGDCGVQQDLTPGVLKRVRIGLMKSPYTIQHIREYCGKRF